MCARVSPARGLTRAQQYPPPTHTHHTLAFKTYSFTFRLLCTNQPTSPPPCPPALPTLVQYYCTLIAYWTIYDSPSDLPFICYTPYNIGNNNIEEKGQLAARAGAVAVWWGAGECERARPCANAVLLGVLLACLLREQRERVHACTRDFVCFDESERYVQRARFFTIILSLIKCLLVLCFISLALWPRACPCYCVEVVLLSNLFTFYTIFIH